MLYSQASRFRQRNIVNITRNSVKTVIDNTPNGRFLLVDDKPDYTVGKDPGNYMCSYVIWENKHELINDKKDNQDDFNESVKMLLLNLAARDKYRHNTQLLEYVRDYVTVERCY